MRQQHEPCSRDAVVRLIPEESVDAIIRSPAPDDMWLDDRSRARANILLVDDNPANLLALEAVLDDLGHNLVKAASGQEALQRLLDQDFAVLLLDVRMPVLDGFETAALIRSQEQSRHTPIIFLTAYEENRLSVEAAYALGAVDYFVTPVVPVILRSKVAGFVELFEQTEQIKRQAEQLRLMERQRFERTLAEENARLRESEGRLRTLSNNLPNGAIYQAIADARGGRRFLYISAGVEQLFGVAAVEAKADASALYGLIHEEDRPRVAAAEEAALRDQSLYDCEFRSRTRTGDVRWIHCRSAPRRLPTGEVIWEGVILDVTARKNVEAELARLAAESQKRRRLYEAALSNTPDLVYVFDLDHRFMYANEGLLRMWGKTWDEAIGKNCLELGYEPWHVAMHDREIEQVVATKQSIKGEVPFIGTLGRRIYEYIFVPVLGDNGEVEAVAGTTRDVTEHHVLEQQLRDQAERLREADRRKDEFLAMLAHELRNPLAPIRNAVQVSRLLGPGDPNLQRSRDMIERQVRHLTRLVDDLLDVSRLTQGKITLQKEPVELATVVAQAVETSRPLIEARGHELAVTLPCEPLQVEADATRLAQVVSNLLNNAAKYNPKGGRIALTVESRPGEAVVRVRDDGVGIAAELLPRIFDLFTQGDRSLARSEEGLGIGLTLVKSLVEMHGGSVEARSDGSDKGSEFVVCLPTLRREPAALAESGESGPSSSQPSPSRRVLVVDDNVDAAESLAMLLRAWGHEVRTTHDGLAALNAAEQVRPEVIFLDIGLPRMDGYEVARRIRERTDMRDVLLVALTGYGQEEDRCRAKEAGFDAHLTKPANPTLLQELLAGMEANT